MSTADDTPESQADSRSAAPRTRALAESPVLAERAAELLRTPLSVLPLSEADARCIVGYMRLAPFARGTVVLRAGDRQSSGHLLLVLEGELAVDLDETGAVAISALGPGSLIGEMALLDGAARSATCTALSDVQAAGLSRRGLQRLADEHPAVAARLLAALAQRLSERLRAMNEQIQLVTQLNAELRAQLSARRPPGA